MSLSELPLAELTARLASSDPAPGAGPAAACTCAVAAALVEMVCAVGLRRDPDDAAAAARRARAEELRRDALALADRDVAAYGAVLDVLRRRDEPGHGARLRDALSHAAGPPLAIAEAAAATARLAAEAESAARGGVRGEAQAAAALAAGAARAAARLVALNLAGAPDDPRHARAAELVRAVSG